MSKPYYSGELRRVFKSVVNDIAKVITRRLKDAPSNEIELDDVKGSLIYNQIDDQESEVITRAYLRYDPNSPDKSSIMVEVDDTLNGYDVEFSTLGIELMFNVLEAIEVATE